MKSIIVFQLLKLEFTCVSSSRNVQDTTKQTLLDDVDIDNHDTIGIMGNERAHQDRTTDLPLTCFLCLLFCFVFFSPRNRNICVHLQSSISTLGSKHFTPQSVRQSYRRPKRAAQISTPPRELLAIPTTPVRWRSLARKHKIYRNNLR